VISERKQPKQFSKFKRRERKKKRVEMISLHEKSHSFLPFFGAWQPILQEEIPRFLLQFIAFL